MNILAIGSSSFIAQSLQNLVGNSGKYHFIPHTEALDISSWPESTSSVINFACDPVIRQGKYSDFDHKCAEIAEKLSVHYIMMSTRAVYGRSKVPQTYDENSEFLDDVTPYGLAKRLIEADLQENFENITILRPSNVFGFEYSQQQPRKTFFGQMLKSLKEEGYITFDIAKTTTRDFLPVKVLAEYIDVIAKTPQRGVLNLGSHTGIPLQDIAESVISGFGAGEIRVTSGVERDSFTLNATKAQEAYNLNQVTKSDILEECVKIGRQLRSE